MSLNFDAVIMNPPYDRNTHLKILDNVINEFPDAEVVNLSPIRWLQDPTAEYKKNSDFKKFENIRNHIEDLESMDVQEAGRIFGAWISTDLGYYHLTKRGGWQPEENKLLKKMIDKKNDTIKNHIIVDDLDGTSLLIAVLSGNHGKNFSSISEGAKKGFNLSKDRAFYTNKRNETTNETYEEYRKRTAWGVCGVKSENTNIKFNSREERDNFYDSWNTKTLRYMFGAMMIADNHVHVEFLPWLGDYTRPWTDKDLYEYFNLTPEEIEEIESTVQ